jgi:hypothetical protein
MNDVHLCSAFPWLFDISLSQEVNFEHVIQCEFNIPFMRRMTSRYK